MLHIALCDDDPRQLEKLTSMLQAWQKNRPDLVVRASAFSSVHSLIEAVSAKGFFDLYLLDMVMPAMNGIDLGLQLRRLGDNGLIIYLTTSPDFAVDSYRVRAFDYLLKPLQQERFESALNAAVAQLRSHKMQTITVKGRGILTRIEYDHILYVELYNRAIRYCLKDGSTVDSVSLRVPFHVAMEPLLAEKKFIMCGASFTVNLEQVSAVSKDGVVFKNGLQLSLAKKACATLRSEWMNYWLEEE